MFQMKWIWININYVLCVCECAAGTLNAYQLELLTFLYQTSWLGKK